MELAPAKRKASKLASEDIINRMPENVITHILDCLPIQHAVRTSILSRNWRFNWTLLSRLVLDEEFYKYLVERGREDWYDETNISRLFLHLKGPITKFVLYIPNNMILDVNHWVMFLSRKGIKEFFLKNMHVTPLKLSTHLFSCLELKYLRLRNCSLHLAPTFCGFPNLLRLDLYQVAFKSGNLGEIITQCPLLEYLNIINCGPIGKVKLVEIAKLKNLKMLSLQLCKLDNIAITSSLIFHLGGLFPKLLELFLDLRMCKFLGEAGARKWVHTSFPCLKTLVLHPIDFSVDIELLFAFEMIWGSPKLQTLFITTTYMDVVPPLAFGSSELNHITMGQLQLRNVEFRYFRGSENEIYLIKNLLACSPLLEKIAIYPSPSLGDNGKLMLFPKLLNLRRASSIADIEIDWS